MIASFLSPGELFEKGLDGKKLFMACLDETAELGAHFACFTCFTRTKVQTLTQKALLGAQFACFTGTKVHILTQKALLPTTCTDCTEDEARGKQNPYERASLQTCVLILLYVCPQIV